MRCKPAESPAPEPVDEDAHPLEQLELLDERARDLEKLGDTEAVIECRVKQLALHQILRHLYDFPLRPMICARAALAEAYALGGFSRQAHEHLELARDASHSSVMDDGQCQHLRVDLLLAEGAVLLAGARNEEAREALGKALQAAREVNSEVDARGARARALLGQIAQQRRRFKEAAEHFAAAQEVHRALEGEGSPEALRAQMHYAEALHLGGRIEEAIEAQSEAVEGLRDCGTLPEAFVDGSAQLARWLEAQGQDQRALEALKAAEQAVAEELGPEAPRVVDLKRDIALLHTKLGEHDAALEHLNDVHYLERRLHGSRSAAVARTLKALGTLHLARHSPDEAERCLRQALRICEAEHPPRMPVIREIHAQLNCLAAPPEA